MKLLTLLFTCLLAISLQAQYVIVNSPASIERPYEFSAGSFGGDLSSGVWTADAVFVDDGTADPTLGCEEPINAAELSGKIALIDRGECDFSLKAKNAEDAGAIAVVVFNHTAGAGTFSMGGADLGDQVTIPAVMLSYEDGQTIRGELASGPVNMTIGNFKYEYEIAVEDKYLLHAPNSVMPAFQAEAAGWTITPGADVKNYGTENATGVLLNATIDFAPIGGSGSQVYSEGGQTDLIEPDSTGLIALTEYTPSEGKGIYTINYTLESDIQDPVAYNDTDNTQFYLSDNIFMKGRWDFANNRPFATNSYRSASGTQIEIMSAFTMPVGVGYMIDSVQFYVSTNADNLGVVGNNNIRAYVYAWDDLDADGDAETAEITPVAISLIEFPNPTLTADYIKVPFVKFPDLEGKYSIPEDGMTFIVGLRYEGDEEVFFGVDEVYDQTAFVENLAQTDVDLPYFWVSAWVDDVPDLDNTFVFTDFWGSLSTALIINEDGSNVTVEELANASIQIFPNPVSDRFTAEVDLGEMSSYLEYSIRDVSGRLLFSSKKENLRHDKSEFDASSLPAGQYFLTIKTDKGSSSKTFSVQH